MMFCSALLGCDGSPVTTVPPGEMPIYDITRNPVIWVSDTIYSSYNPTDSIATIRLPRLLLDTSHAQDILVSHVLSDEHPECEVVNARTGLRYRTECPSMYDWWEGRYESALRGSDSDPFSAFIDDTRAIRMWSRNNPGAWAQLIRYRRGYEPVLLNKTGRSGTDGVHMASDTDGIWLRWRADLDFSGCQGYSQDSPIDTLVKLDATGERVEVEVLNNVWFQDFTIAHDHTWILTALPVPSIIQLTDGNVVGEYVLNQLSQYGYDSIVFVNDTLWTSEYHYTGFEPQTILRQFAFTASNPRDSAHQLDSLIIPGFVDSGPTWDGEAFVYWSYGNHGQILTRRDRSGRVIESVRSTLYLTGDVCGALGSHWVTHHGPYGATTRGVFLSRVEF